MYKFGNYPTPAPRQWRLRGKCVGFGLGCHFLLESDGRSERRTKISMAAAQARHIELIMANRAFIQPPHYHLRDPKSGHRSKEIRPGPHPEY